MTEVDFAPEFQADVLSVLLTNKERFKTARSFVSADTFTIPECKWIYEHALSVFDSSGDLPTSGLVAQEATSSFGDGEFEHLIAVHHDLMQGRSAPKEIMSSAARFSEDASYRAVARKHDKLVELGKFSEARELMESQSWKIVGPSQEERRVILGYNDIEKVLDRAKARRDDPEAFKFSTGIRELDALMKGGYRRQHMLMILGWTGRGKSTVSVNMASTNVKRGHKGIYISSEMTVDEIFVKMIARETMTAYDLIYEYSFDKTQEGEFLKLLNHKVQSYKDLLVVEQTGIYGTNRASLIDAMDRAADFFGEEASWVVFDTLSHCETDKYKDAHKGAADNLNWCKSQLEERDAAGIVTAQANRDGAVKTDESNVADTIEGARVAQWIVAVNDPDENNLPDAHASIDDLLQPPDFYQGKVLSLLKARFGRTGDVPVSTNLECSFVGDLYIENNVRG